MWPSTRVTQSSLGGLPASRTDRLSGGPSLATNTHPLDIRPLSSVKLNETVPVMAIPTRMGMVRGMIWGGLIGLNPVLGMVAGRRSWSRRGGVTARCWTTECDSFIKGLGEKSAGHVGVIHSFPEGKLGKGSRSGCAVWRKR